jgi:enoyl-CoA hydratase
MTDEILFDRRGAAGLVTLNRPAALNTVTRGMVRALAEKLADWENDPAVTRIVIDAAPARAFCAGGDIRAIYELGRAGRHDEALAFFREEYILNTTLKRYRKPYVSLIDGIVMGGGCGLTIHGSHRVAGDKYQLAMPEVSIGFFPDVGATWALPRLPGEIGTWCALTAERLKTADGVATGAATHHVRSDRLADLRDALCGNVPVDAVLPAFAEPRGEGPVSLRQAAITGLFGGDTVESIIQALDREGASGSEDAQWARDTAAVIRTKSPTSLKLALAQMRRGASLSFEDCMKTEFRIVSRIIHDHDFYEGVRALIIDKDNTPRWQPARLEDVGAEAVERYFHALGEVELALA